jgi:hypothetical protein
LSEEAQMSISQYVIGTLLDERKILEIIKERSRIFTLCLDIPIDEVENILYQEHKANQKKY